ncbi:acyl-CoA thioesterase/BAAT N-terminal domain-containing protein [Leifsonia sp. F6_8S_P_1B]|uniref:Acyl-CoA thioesterase/BAAT N-terminal domain-containing protein n=1 Tax=Leifsonia williamsii TaxID=3035919 RepID=A0ABT8KA15_9MICO|nr:acyl-CoA thioesterase/BAAT N-terminal domain-containing protein [Leifsonia williamsii]MDN4614290.1 acyl-CoA thioesterase/BAAT N-terminal domain-containing protein [Leifsonia williamsii]
MTGRALARVLRVVAALAVVLLLPVLAGCAPARTGTGPRFQVAQNPSPAWEAVHLRLVALPPGERVTITAAVGRLWTSRAVYAVPATGVVDLDKEAPLEAPFTGVDGMGLFWSLRSAAGAAATADEGWGISTQSVDLRAAIAGRRVAETRVQRVGLAAAAPSRAVFDAGISGDYFRPVASGEALRPGVLVLDGTDPGAQTGVLAASTLSAMGYPALALSTFGPAGQLDPRRVFTAERLLSAVAWLRSQPGVDDQRIFVFGTSRGAQLALWSAVAFPGTVYGAIAPGGTTGLVCPSPVPSPAVTVGGSWVPCVSGTREPSPAAVLDLGRIPGPVVLGCAGADEQLETGCAWLDAAAKIRPPESFDVYLRAPGATHYFYLPPYSPLLLPPAPHAQATEDARVAFWGAVESALSAPSSLSR